MAWLTFGVVPGVVADAARYRETPLAARMGIRTFLNVITDEESRVLCRCPDTVIRALIDRLWGLQSVCAERASGSDAQAGFCVLAVLRELLEEAERDKPDGTEREIYLEVGTKFWEVYAS